MHRAAFGLGWPQVLYKNITSKNVAILVSHHYPRRLVMVFKPASCVCEQRSYYPPVVFSRPDCEAFPQ